MASWSALGIGMWGLLLLVVELVLSVGGDGGSLRFFFFLLAVEAEDLDSNSSILLGFATSCDCDCDCNVGLGRPRLRFCLSIMALLGTMLNLICRVMDKGSIAQQSCATSKGPLESIEEVLQQKKWLLLLWRCFMMCWQPGRMSVVLYVFTSSARRTAHGSWWIFPSGQQLLQYEARVLVAVLA